LNRIAPSLFPPSSLALLGVELNPLFRRTLALDLVGVLGAMGVLEAVELVGDGGAIPFGPAPGVGAEEGKSVAFDEELRHR
jgi:hypothetical protein